jgi:hypothetical protein
MFRFDQPIAPLPGWFQTVVNYQGDASIERRVTEDVASFGKQLGIISEALIEVAGDKRPGPKLARLCTIVAEIDEIKQRQHRSFARETTDSFEQLADRDPVEARRLIGRLIAVVDGAQQRKNNGTRA